MAWLARLRPDELAGDTRRLLGMMILLILTVALTTRPVIHDALSVREVTIALALVSSACGAMAAILSGVLGSLTDEPRARWVGIALALYSLVGVPAATIGATVQRGEAAIGNVRLYAHTTFVVLGLVAVFAPRIRSGRIGWAVLPLGMGLAVLVAALGAMFPESSLAVTTSQPLRLGLTVVWVTTGLALVLVTGGGRSGTGPWIGWAFLVVAVAHVFRVAVGDPMAPLGLTFTTVRLLGVLVLLAATLAATRRALAELDHSQFAQEEALRQAHLGLQRVAERDHELRNGLAGLAGVSVLLGAPAAGDSASLLRAAVSSELTRLNSLLQRPAGPPPPTPRDYAVVPVLHQQIELRNAAGAIISLDTDPDLRVVGDPAVLAQVLTNLFTNCAMHAPDSPVSVQARRAGDRIVIRVRDFGPGVRPGAERAVFSPGARRPDSPGQGLGLSLCQRLLAAESARIRIERRSPGCTTVLELAAAEPGRPEVSDSKTRCQPCDRMSIRNEHSSASPAQC